MLVIGHRGASGHRAENTLSSLRHALTLGADGVEFDVRALGSHLILLHDGTLDRTTNGSGRYDAFEFRALRAFKTATGEPIPTLEEALLAAAAGRIINVELKDPGAADRLVDHLSAELKQGHIDAERLLLSSFDTAATATLAARRGAMRLGILYDDEDFDAALQRAVALGAWSLHMPLAALDSNAVECAHAKGLRVLVYTVNTDADLARCRNSGVDGVFSDFPDRAVALKRRMAKEI